MNFLESEDLKQGRRPLFLFLIVTLGVGALASLFTAPAIPTWYAALNRPSFAPSNSVFAPVWTALQILTAIAGWRAWRRTGLKSPEMAAFAIQLALNFAWSVLLFGLHQTGAALIEIVMLNMAVLATLLLFFRRDRWAGLLFLPYLAWTLFAAFLTQALWRLN